MGGLFGDPWNPRVVEPDLLRIGAGVEPTDDQDVTEAEAILALIDSVEAALQAEIRRKDLMISIVDLPTADPTEPLLRWTLTRAVDFDGNGAGAATAGIAATATSSLRLRKNGAANGTIAFTGTSGVISFTDPSYAAGDLFELYPPAAIDATLDEVSITFQTG